MMLHYNDDYYICMYYDWIFVYINNDCDDMKYENSLDYTILFYFETVFKILKNILIDDKVLKLFCFYIILI